MFMTPWAWDALRTIHPLTLSPRNLPTETVATILLQQGLNPRLEYFSLGNLFLHEFCLLHITKMPIMRLLVRRIPESGDLLPLWGNLRRDRECGLRLPPPHTEEALIAEQPEGLDTLIRGPQGSFHQR